MPSNALAKFKRTIARCEALVDSYKVLHAQNRKDGATPAPKDIIRGAVVLAVAALDAYVTDVFCEKLVPYLKRYKSDDSLVKLLSDAGLDTREALNLLSMERPYRRIRTLITRHYETYTTQKFNVIDEIFLPFRLKNITCNAEAKTGKKRLKKSVGLLVDRRNEIAHGGDYNSHGRIKNINEDQIAKRIKHLEQLVIAIDEIICNRI
ncbi:HEPN domain-containing protein [endosymbiont of unidentified scaly snail isolate Monju]|uniref:HEPN domain-containing protein n=1 Tax=endosymbiont of unidentified scaly snail isolate Monju TaxID=1248727 RepID=UPI000389268C|nr:HEPN domain-containing protein [endosymbiont of unidentified scaly snail isolate Monju]BAN69487.1 hypothetical protein EBS_1606 [endosymbiont of unidentified scaly snail isolate Monju]